MYPLKTRAHNQDPWSSRASIIWINACLSSFSYRLLPQTISPRLRWGLRPLCTFLVKFFSASLNSFLKKNFFIFFFASFASARTWSIKIGQNIFRILFAVIFLFQNNFFLLLLHEGGEKNAPVVRPSWIFCVTAFWIFIFIFNLICFFFFLKCMRSIISLSVFFHDGGGVKGVAD